MDIPGLGRTGMEVAGMARAFSFAYADCKGQILDLFLENLKRYLNGGEMLSVINKERGY